MANTALPPTFRFSQGSLQDYVDCQRRFQLRYALMQPWPALVTDSPGAYEQHVRRAADLHRLAHQYHLEGEAAIDPERLSETIDDAELLGWWQTFLAHPPPGIPETVRRPEVVLTAPLAGHRLLAKVDLLAAEPGQRLVVVDWKTVRRRPPRAILARRLQTRVYRTLAVVAGAAFFGGGPPAPEQVEMLYWFATDSGRIERFAYDADQHAADRTYLASLIEEVIAHREPVWPLTDDVDQCRFCKYRSLCERGVQPGFFDELDVEVEPESLEIDLEQIAEIEY
jgi:CRISPR/Cas system-associated exonuclease Cas4 (RecB family)